MIAVLVLLLLADATFLSTFLAARCPIALERQHVFPVSTALHCVFFFVTCLCDRSQLGRVDRFNFRVAQQFLCVFRMGGLSVPFSGDFRSGAGLQCELTDLALSGQTRHCQISLQAGQPTCFSVFHCP